MDSKKTQTVVVVILVITALLGIVGAALVYYLSTQERAKKEDTQQKEYCACIRAYTTPSCNNCQCTQMELQALESVVGEVIDGVCSLDCDVTIPDSEETPETINCLVSKVLITSCHSVSVRDSDTKELIIPPISTEKPILITANFVPQEINGVEEQFTKFVFIVNGVSTEIDASSVTSTTLNEQKTFVPEIEFADFQDIDTLTIQAIAYSDRNPDGTSPGRYCHKKYSLTQERGPFCSNLVINTQPGTQTNTKIINKMELNMPNLTKNEDIQLEFSFDHEALQTIKTKVLPQNLLEEILVRETIFLEYEHLYSSPELYENEKGFSIFDERTLDVDSLKISAQLYVNNQEADSSLCQGNIALTKVAEEEEERVEEEREEEQREEEEEEEKEVTETKPEIIVKMEGPTCVQKAENEQSTRRTNYRITITNNSTTAQDISSVTNKLPLGFKYLPETTSIDKSLVSDAIVTVTNIAESQEIVWTNNWTIKPKTSLVIEYGVNVTNKAIDGQNQNEAVVKSVNIPQDISKLRAEFITTVGGNCEHQENLPETGRITVLTLIIGLLALLIGLTVYKGKFAIIDKLIYSILGTRTVKKAIMPTREYFEDQILEKEEKEKQD